MNRIVLVGRLENTPEIRFTSSGIPVSNFSLSVRRSHPNSDGIWEKDVFRVVTWRKLAETCCKYLEKGRWVAVDGKLQNRFFNTDDNERRVMVEIHADDIRFLDFRNIQRDSESDRSDVESDMTTDDSRTDNGKKQEIEIVGKDKSKDLSIDPEHYLKDEEGTPLDSADE